MAAETHDARTTARILRVNHGGEHADIRIYRGQIAFARLTCPDLLPFLRETLRHEERHLAIFRTLMPARKARPCRLMWLFGMGGAALGWITGLIGRGGVLACTEVVERTVHRHLQDQLQWLDGRDDELAAAIRDIQVEELQHLTFAESRRAPAGAVGRPLDTAIGVATEAVIWLTTRGESVRLARALVV